MIKYTTILRDNKMEKDPNKIDLGNTEEETKTDRETDSLLHPKPLTYEEAIKLALKLSLSTVGTYTFSFGLTAHAVLSGHLGEEYLGPTILSTSTVNAFASIAISTTFAVAPTVKRYLGLKQTEQASAILKRAIILSLPTTIAFAIPLIFSEEMLRAFGQSPENARLAGRYLSASAPLLPILGARLAAEQVLFAHDKHPDTMKIALLTFLPSTFFAYVLCFGKFGAPKLELEGLAYSMLMQECLTLSLFLLYLHAHPKLKPFNLVRNMFTSLSKKDFQEIKALLSFGLPITATVTSDVIASFMLPLFAGLTGEKGISAYNISGQLAALMQFLTAAFGQTMMAQVAGAVSNDKIEDARKLIHSGLIAAMLVIGPICITAMSAPQIIENIFSDTNVEDGVTDLAKKLTPIVASGVIFDALRYYFLQILRATGDNNKATMIATSFTLLGVIFAFVLGDQYDSTLLIVLAYEISIALSAAVLAPRFLKNITPAFLEQVHKDMQISNTNNASSVNNETDETKFLCC